MFDKMKQIMEMKQKAEQIKKDLEKMLIEVNEVEGIHIVIDGAQNFHSIRCDEKLLGIENKEKLEECLLKSIQAAKNKAQSAAAGKMSSLMPGL